jgi:hypothetical protein
MRKGVGRGSPVTGRPSRQVVVGLAAHDDARLAVLAEDDRRARLAVVVVGHRVAVAAGRRRDRHVAGLRVGQVGGLDDHVAGLAVLADEVAVGAAAEAVGDLGLVAGAVEHRAQVVRHAAVDADPRRDVALDRLDGVDRHAAVGHQRAAGLVHDRHVLAEVLVHGLDLGRGVVGDARASSARW